MKTNPMLALALLGGALLGGCAGVVPAPLAVVQASAQGDDDEGGKSDQPSGKAASACESGKMVRSAYYWQGRRTASGERFNPEGMTAAHRTLPFGTKLKVTNPRTGKTVDVVVNDRGPFTRGLHLDLSRGAARAIGLHSTGTVCIST